MSPSPQAPVPSRCRGREADGRGAGWQSRMTQEYLAGELSLLLEQLQAAMTNAALVVEVAHLRQQAETGPRSALASVVVRALEVADLVCWDSLTRGDAAAFIRQATVCAELWEFGVCAGLLEDR